MELVKVFDSFFCVGDTTEHIKVDQKTALEFFFQYGVSSCWKRHFPEQLGQPPGEAAGNGASAVASEREVFYPRAQKMALLGMSVGYPADSVIK